MNWNAQYLIEGQKVLRLVKSASKRLSRDCRAIAAGTADVNELALKAHRSLDRLDARANSAELYNTPELKLEASRLVSASRTELLAAIAVGESAHSKALQQDVESARRAELDEARSRRAHDWRYM